MTDKSKTHEKRNRALLAAGAGFGALSLTDQAVAQIVGYDSGTDTFTIDPSPLQDPLVDATTGGIGIGTILFVLITAAIIIFKMVRRTGK